MNWIAKVMTRTRWEGLAILVVASVYLIELSRIPAFFEVPGVPGPTAFPRLLGIVFGLCGLWLLASGGERRAEQSAAQPEPAQARAAQAAPRPGLLQRLLRDSHFYAMWAAVLGYLIIWPILGFPVATFLLLLAFFYLMEETRWPVVLGLSLVSTVVIYLLFAKGLNVKLGLGLLESLFR